MSLRLLTLNYARSYFELFILSFHYSYHHFRIDENITLSHIDILK
jgi:hypothetical protein